MPGNAHTKTIQPARPATDGEPTRQSSASESAALSSIDLSSVAMVVCPACQAANPRLRKFCGACGQALREPCVECDAETLLGEAFCGECGVDLQKACQDRAGLAEADLLQAQRLCDEAMFSEAQQLLAPWIARKQLALADVARRAAELAEKVDARCQGARQEVDVVTQQAEQALEKRQWSQVIASIERIPKLLRDRKHAAMVERASGALDELKKLGREIRDAIQNGKLVGLLSKVERALELDPNNEKLTGLSKQLEQRSSRDACHMARQRLGEAEQKVALFQYGEALQLLEEVPAAGRDKQFQATHQHICELAYLWNTLRNTPVVDKSLLAIANRLAKYSPGDRRVERIIEQLRQRLEKQQARPLAAIAWARAPQEPALGYPVKRLTSLGAIEVEDVAGTPLFAENVNRLYVACGVALQGLRKSAIDVNLCPQPKSRLGRIGTLLKSAPKAESAWGIDLSSSGLKAVRMVLREQGAVVAIKNFDVVEHATPLPGLVNEAQRRDVIADTLQRFLKRNPTQGDVVCISFPGMQALTRFLSIPPTDAKQTQELMRYEARQQVPLPLEQLAWDYHIWQPPEADSELPRDAMLLATKQFHISQRLQPLEDAGLRPHILQCDCVALYNFYRYTLAADAPPHNDTWTVLCDIGADGTNFVACGRNRLWYRSLPRGGNEFSQALVRRAKLKFSQAEHLKIHPEQTRRFSDLYDTWRPIYDHLLRDIRDSLEAFGKTHRRAVIDRILLCGGALRTHGLHRHLVE